MNETLARQLRRLGIDHAVAPEGEKWLQLLERLSAHYEETERSRYLLERSMQISSEEMLASYKEIQRKGQLRESHYRNLFNKSPIAIWEEDFSQVGVWLGWLRASGVTDLQAYLNQRPDDFRRLVGMIRIIDVNAAAVALMRAPDKEALIGTMDSELYTQDPVILESFRAELQAVWDGATRTSFEFAGTRWDESSLYGILNWSAPRVEGRRDLSRVAVAIVDITERKEAEDRLEDLMRSKDDFLATVSHELRTPLTTVYASAETLRESGADLDDDLREELIGYIARESGELSDMVDDLLVAARSEIGKITIAPRQTDLSPIVERVVEVATIEQDHDVVIEVVGSVWADPLRLKQIIRNLVSNAMRYGGRSVRIQSETSGATTHITVLDDGAGVPREHRESIFELYERGQQTLASVGTVGSVGVGLAVARQLAHLMDGELEYDYARGWSRFRLTLPSAPPTPQESRPAAESDGIVTYINFGRSAS